MTTTTRKPTPRKTPRPATPTDNLVELDTGVVEFEATFVDEDTEEPAETHTFRARPRFGYKRMREAALASSRGGIDAVMRFEKMIVPSLLDDDGTPNGWAPDADDIDDDEFTDPTGERRPIADLRPLMEFEAGSSRRRWAHLMDKRDDLGVKLSELVRIYELLVETSTSRPTSRSKSS